MTAFLSLWLPILVATVAVFIISSIVNTVMPWHRNDLPKVPDEDRVMDALRPAALPPGEYMLPRSKDMKEMATPEYIEKLNRGPVMILTVFPNGPISMTRSLILWAVYVAAVTKLAAWFAAATLAPGAHGHAVFHYTAVPAFVAYVMALWQMPIWYGRPWTSTLKSTLDGLIYAVATGLVFMWLWPGL